MRVQGKMLKRGFWMKSMHFTWNGKNSSIFFSGNKCYTNTCDRRLISYI